MAIPFEAAPATVFKESDIAEFGLALQDRQEAKETQKRERFEKAYKETNLPAWTQRDTAVMKYASAVRDLLLDPAIYNAKTGSPEHIRGLRAKEQLERVAAASGANKKRFEEEIDFLKNNPDAEGVDMLTAYHDMPFDGEVVIDEYGNGLVNGEPIITHPALSTPPSLRKRRDVYTFDKFEDRVNVGISSYENENGVTTVSPNDAEALVRIVYKTSRPQDKRDLLNIFMANNLGLTAEQVDMLDPEEIAIYEEAMLKEQAKAALLRSDTKTSRESGGGRGGLLGEFDKKSFVKIEPKFGSNVVPSGTEFKSGLAIPNVPFISNYLAPAKEGETTASVGSGGDKGEIIFVSEVAQDKDGNLYVSGVKKTGDISKIVAVGGDGSVGVAQGVRMIDLLASQGYQTKTINKFKLEGNDAANFIAAMKIQGVNSVDQFKKAMDDFYGVTAEPQAQGGQSSGDGLNASEIKQQKQNTEQESSGLNASERKGK